MIAAPGGGWSSSSNSACASAGSPDGPGVAKATPPRIRLSTELMSILGSSGRRSKCTPLVRQNTELVRTSEACSGETATSSWTREPSWGRAIAAISPTSMPR